MRSLYLERPGWLHRVGAGTKLAVLALCGTALALTSRPEVLAAALALAGLLYLSLGAAALRRIGLLRGIAVAGLLIVGFHWLLGTPALGLATGLRLGCAALLALMLTLTTRFEDLLAVLERVLHPLSWMGLPVDRIALGLGLVLRFAENFHAQWQRLDDAHRARTGRGGGLRLLGPLTIQALLAAERVADALAARLGR